MMDKEIFNQIVAKKDFSQLPKVDVEMAFEHFRNRQVSLEEKIRLTRELLHKVFASFTSKKLLSLKDKDPEWILRKHLSTRERLPYYSEVYERLLGEFGEEKLTVFDLGAGINGFSFQYFPNKKNFYYVGIEAMGQLVELMNYYFKTRGLEGMALHESLFSLDKIKKILSQGKEKKVVFLFKALDSLEMMKGDYSKKLLREIAPLVDKIVVSFATQSMTKRTRFKVNRKWIIDFIKENFNLIEDFEIGPERYVVFSSN